MGSEIIKKSKVNILKFIEANFIDLRNQRFDKKWLDII